MPVFSIIIPAYNNSQYLPECVRSITEQDFQDFEIIIVDDASSDNTYATASSLAGKDNRITALRHKCNRGTLAARATGVSAARGDFILLIDQDDELAAGTLSQLTAFAEFHPADIYHYGVQVVSSTPAAQHAAAGMTAFLTPTPRTLHAQDILKTQFAEQNNFDWHVHHKMYRADLMKRAYAMATDERLILSDDLYMCFILDSLAETYCAIPNSPWYIYHLGRGDTFGEAATIDRIDRLAYWESEAFRHIKDFVKSQRASIPRNDWDQRVQDAGTRLIEHTMNEWKDALPSCDQDEGLRSISRHWPADMICAEIYRYVRDHAYAYYVNPDKNSPTAANDKSEALRFLNMAKTLEQQHADMSSIHNKHYEGLKNIAFRHLSDGGLIPAQQGAPHEHRSNGTRSVLFRLISTIKRKRTH